MEDVFYEKLELKKDNSRPNNLEHLGQAMMDAGNEFGPTTAYGSALMKVAQTELKLGAHEHEFLNATAANTLVPIRRFLEGDMKTIQVTSSPYCFGRIHKQALLCCLEGTQSLTRTSSWSRFL